MLNGAVARSVKSRPESALSSVHVLEQQLVDLRSRLRLAVIFGGNKSCGDSVLYPAHNSRSWKSYEAVAEDIAASLRRNGFQHVDTMPEDMRHSLRRNMSFSVCIIWMRRATHVMLPIDPNGISQ